MYKTRQAWVNINQKQNTKATLSETTPAQKTQINDTVVRDNNATFSQHLETILVPESQKGGR